jgi:hypothetical protein
MFINYFIVKWGKKPNKNESMHGIFKLYPVIIKMLTLLRHDYPLGHLFFFLLILKE